MKSLNKTMIFMIFFMMIYSCVYETKKPEYIDDREIRIDSLVVIKNVASRDTEFHRIRMPFSIPDFPGMNSLLLSSIITNTSSDTLLIKTWKWVNVIDDLQHLQIGDNFFFHLNSFKPDLIVFRHDTLLPNTPKKYYIYHPLGKPRLAYGSTLYLKADMCLYYAAPDTVYFRDSTFWAMPYKYEEKLTKNNSFVIKIDLLESTVHIVDSTFEEILESYKKRNFYSK